MYNRRGGFTLVELLVVAVITAFVLMALYTVMAKNQRAFTVHAAEVSAQQTVRAGLGILVAELREVGAGEDLMVAEPGSIRVRSMDGLGLICAIDYPLSQLTVRPVGDWFENGDSIFVFADGNPQARSDDEWLVGTVGAVDTASACPDGTAAQLLSVPSLTAAMAIDSVRTGGPVRGFVNYTFGLVNIGSNYGWFLSRWQPGGATEPLVGPLQAPAQKGVEFEYFDEAAVTTSTAADVRQVAITLRTISPVTRTTGGYVGDSLTARAFLRN